MVHKHSVQDSGARFVIDQHTRQIKNNSANKTTIVQYDHNSQQVTFEIPLYVDSHAMTLCDLIELHFINISTDGKSANHGTYEVQDIKADGDNAVFTWTISQEATQLAGSLNFFIVFKCTEDGVTVYRWGTEICKTLAVSAGMDNGEAIITEYPDILAQWKAQLFDASNTAVTNVATAEANALAAIEAAGEAKKQSVLDSIPDEYEALSALADQSNRNKAGAIVLEKEGESIVLNDASEYPLQNLKVFGKSTQDGTPTPDAPVDIVSVKNPVVTVCGKNLLKNEAVDNTSAGITFTVNDDGSITANGTSTAISPLVICKSFLFKAGVTYKLTGCPAGGGTSSWRVDNMGTLFDDGEGGTIAYTSDTVAQIRVRIAANVTVENLTFYPMIRIATVGDDTYEPYEEQTVETSHTIPGIPVSSGGNYTDANGQQWICDEVDLARGVYVQRVAKEKLGAVSHYSEIGLYVTLFGGKSKYDTKFICSHFADEVVFANGSTGAYVSCILPKKHLPTSVTGMETGQSWLDEQKTVGTPVTAMYVLSEPIETPLSDAEITAFKALHSNKPNTTILNDAGAHMAVEYVADTKTYIDNKIAALLSNT